MIKWIRAVYYTAAFANIIGVMIFTKGLTNQVLIETHPTLFSQFGILMIMMWGLCYFVCTDAAVDYASISLVFALEKLAYCVSWIIFIQGDIDWSLLYEKDLFAGVFYSIYGVVDGIYLLLFLYCAYSVSSTQKAA